MSKLIDLTGQKFGRLTVIERANNSKDGRTRWKCVCECGSGKEVVVTGVDLRNGHSKSCGCIQKEIASITVKPHYTHGKSNSRIYRIWRNMKSRCYCKKNAIYKYYGERGITVCDEWVDDFKSFYYWAMQNGYADELSIDRKDVNGNYEPNNCRWATKKEQANNTRNNRIITYKGVTLTLSQWSEKTGINSKTIQTRLNNGWSVEKALSTPTLR